MSLIKDRWSDYQAIPKALGSVRDATSPNHGQLHSVRFQLLSKYQANPARYQWMGETADHQ